MNLPLLFDLTDDQLAQWCQSHGYEAYRGDQIRRWILGQRADDFSAMSNLPIRLRGLLAEHFRLFASTVIAHQKAGDGTEKLLLEVGDGSSVECVLMREDDRRTICISTQVGCGMGCTFCASGLLGLQRNLSPGEITEQIVRLNRLLPPRERLTNLVVMGMGEPLANLKHLLQALGNVKADGGIGMGARRITISTVGLPEKIRELAAAGNAYNLAVSLHAPHDALRSRLVPVNNRFGIQAILEAADDYFRQVGRRVTYEYVLLGQVNDLPEHARQLASLLAPRVAHVNLIPMNPVNELPFQRPTDQRVQRFAEILENAGVPTTVRKRKGVNIDAACGQLRLRHQQQRESVVPQPIV